MKKIILITMLMSAVFAQKDCNRNNWRVYYNRDGKDMSDCDLRWASLSSENLTDANLTGANLAGAYLKGAYLTGANLSDANLKGATLIVTKLTGATLTGANLIGANLSGATLTGANLESANLESANLESATLTGANLKYANLTGTTLWDANLTDAILDGVQSGNISEYPQSLPDGWSLVDGTLGNRELSDEIFRQINEGNAIKKSKWRAWKNENDPQVSRGKTTFKNLDKNNNGKISSGEFFKFHKRWIQN